MTNANVKIRPYQKEDKGFIRKISGDTANRGKPVETFFKDREVMEDLLTLYYTDFEPQSSWVAEYEGRVVGYLTGCLNHNSWPKAKPPEQ